MSELHDLALRSADQARNDFYAIQSELEVIQAQLARVPTRRSMLDLTALTILSTAVIVLLGEWLLFHS